MRIERCYMILLPAGFLVIMCCARRIFDQIRRSSFILSAKGFVTTDSTPDSIKLSYEITPKLLSFIEA